MVLALHNLKPASRSKRKKKRVGRGGKRGTYSGRGIKGQRARSGSRAGLKYKGFRSSLLQAPKRKGFRSRQDKPVALNLSELNKHFQAGETVSLKSLYQKGLIRSQQKVKVLGGGKLTKKLVFKEIKVSRSASEKIKEAGGQLI